ncbi:DUF2815 family protein [Staphylococcus saprophyticus]|uniref:DUF2815 family protein n=1 Tax=Staphylococcus saprophyticus TaxID=29385 RepID=UPI000E078733|nr:DUF2815 family protein [Staphylococcus saprophyticus]MDK1672749.1 DUF2815 family protein [Staphylococcus saprophyticus]MDW3896913.1 DUF2815 family protein [Staphylococcus saprophyticus]SUM89367.1 phage protein [Staphylococcus saprophyticus]
MKAKQIGTKVITGKVRASYAHIFEAHSMNEDAPKKYSVSVIIPKSDTQMIETIEKAIDQAKEDSKAKWNGKVPSNLKTPLRDGDTDREDDPNYENAYFINATSQTQPGIVDQNKIRLTEPGTLVSGDYIRASINFYGYNVNGNKGVAAGLNNIQLVEKGEALSGASKAEDDFDDIDSEDEDLL